MRLKLFIVLTASTLLAAGPTKAQEDAALPAICLASASGDHATANMDMGGMAMGGGAMQDNVDEAHQALAAGMDAMHAEMEKGMTATDIDVAFVCAMIPHHQGAIEMAKAELQYGDDPWAREMAQKIIDAQTQEIADMLDWLNSQAQ